MALRYPLDLRFKLVALAPRIYVTDSAGQDVCFVAQKIWNLKEDIQVFNNESRSQELYRIRANQILDFNTTYSFTDSLTGRSIGAIQAKGWQSIWQATYEITDANGQMTHTIQEDNPWVKVADALIGMVPYMDMFTGFFLHPSYTAVDAANGQGDMQIKKEAAFFEGLYSLHQLGEMSEEEEERLMLSFMLMVQFMRRRG